MLVKSIIMTLLLIMSTHSYAGVSGPTPPAPPPKTIIEPSTESWDWTKQDAFVDIINSDGSRGLTPPWDGEDHFGVNMTSRLPTQDDGWRLVEKKFTCADFNPIETCEDPQKLSVNWPRFVLYNPYTGTMRVFILIDSKDNYDADSIIVQYSILDESGQAPPIALLSGNLSISRHSVDNEVPIGSPEFTDPNLERDIYNNSNASDNIGYEVMAKMSHNDWFVFDIPFSYPLNNGFGACTGLTNCKKGLYDTYSSDLFLKIDPYLVKITSLTLSGDQTFTKNGVPIGRDKNTITNTRSITFDDFKKAHSHYKATKADVGGVGEHIEDLGTKKMNADDADDYDLYLGGNLLALGMDVANISTGIGVLTAANSLVSAFSSKGSGGAFDIQFDAATIDLNGELERKTPVSPITIGIPGSKIYKDTDNTELNTIKTTKIDGYTGSLGVYGLRYQPKIKVNYAGCIMNTCPYLTLETNIYDAIVLNPSLEPHIDITEIKYAVEFKSEMNTSNGPSDSTLRSCSANEYDLGVNPNEIKYLLKTKSKGQIDPKSEFNLVISGEYQTSNQGNDDIGKPLICWSSYYSSLYEQFEPTAYLKIQVKTKNLDTGETYSYLKTYEAELIH